LPPSARASMASAPMKAIEVYGSEVLPALRGERVAG
jgi:hypothetical protein